MERQARSLIPAYPRISRSIPRWTQGRRLQLKTRNRGVVLVIALIGLVAMSIAAAFLVRSTSTVNQVAGNIAMRQSVERVAAIGFEMAVDSVANGAVLAAGLENGWRATGITSHKVTGTNCTPGDATNNCWYFPRELFARDARVGTGNTVIPSVCRTSTTAWAESTAIVPAGVPVCVPAQIINGTTTPAAAIDWFSDEKFPALTHTNDTRIPEGYSIRYVVDRQCAVSSSDNMTWNPESNNAGVIPPKTSSPQSIRKFCRTVETTATTVGNQEWSTQTADQSKYQTLEAGTTLTAPQTYFRVSVQIIGPRATVHFAQALVLI